MTTLSRSTDRKISRKYGIEHKLNKLVDGHTVEVQIGRVRIDGVDYGPANNDSEIYFRSNGSYHQLLVNGEQRGPTRK